MVAEDFRWVFSGKIFSNQWPLLPRRHMLVHFPLPRCPPRHPERQIRQGLEASPAWTRKHIFSTRTASARSYEYPWVIRIIGEFIVALAIHCQYLFLLVSHSRWNEQPTLLSLVSDVMHMMMGAEMRNRSPILGTNECHQSWLQSFAASSTLLAKFFYPYYLHNTYMQDITYVVATN